MRKPWRWFVVSDRSIRAGRIPPGPLEGWKMKYYVEAWTFPSDEDSCETECDQTEEFTNILDAMRWCWDRMEEGFQTRLWRR